MTGDDFDWNDDTPAAVAEPDPWSTPEPPERPEDLRVGDKVQLTGYVVKVGNGFITIQYGKSDFQRLAMKASEFKDAEGLAWR